jgi:hypothetical protein
MTETRFTPGPWIALIDQQRKPHCFKIVSFAENPSVVVSLPADHKNKADIPLISASLEGYELAEAVAEFFTDLRNGKPVSTDQMNEIWMQAEAYLCKARGHQHGESSHV